MKYICEVETGQIVKMNNKDADKFIKWKLYNLSSEREFNKQEKRKILRTMRGSK